MRSPTLVISLLALGTLPATAQENERTTLGGYGEVHFRNASGPKTPGIVNVARFVAFLSEASNLVTGDDNGRFDAFVRDRAAGTTELVSLGPDGRRLSVDSIELSVSHVWVGLEVITTQRFMQVMEEQRT